MLEKILERIDSMSADLFGEMIEADNAYDYNWCGQILAKQEVLNELREFVEDLQKTQEDL